MPPKTRVSSRLASKKRKAEEVDDLSEEDRPAKRQKIEKKLLEEYFKKEANIFITVKLAGLRYTINGEIGSPGTNVLYQDKATIMEAKARIRNPKSSGFNLDNNVLLLANGAKELILMLADCFFLE